MTVTPPHSLAALTDIAYYCPFFTLFVFLMRWQREARWNGMVLQHAGLGSDIATSICIIFHPLSYESGLTSLMWLTFLEHRHHHAHYQNLRGLLEKYYSNHDEFNVPLSVRPRLTFTISTRVAYFHVFVLNRPFTLNTYLFNIYLGI